MKKSDVLKSLEQMLYSTGAYSAPVDYYLDREELAKEILETIEELGFKRVVDKDYGYDGSQIEEVPYEPE
jgi:hypothetical protein